MPNPLVRSALFVPGSRPERFSKALASGADAVIVDFEDAVEEPLKRQARANLGAFLQSHPQAEVWVRINAPEHAEHFEDVAFCKAHANVAGVLLPKVESAAQVAVVAAAGKVIWPIIESARGLLAVADIARAPQVQRLSFGGLDLALDLNLSSNSPAAQFALDQGRQAFDPFAETHWGGDFGAPRMAGLLAGFDGLLLTDDLDMEALSGSVPERAEIAAKAGCDIALNCWAKMDDMTGTCEVLPAMSEATAARLDRALAGTNVADTIAPQAADLLAKRDALLALTGASA